MIANQKIIPMSKQEIKEIFKEFLSDADPQEAKEILPGNVRLYYAIRRRNFPGTKAAIYPHL